MSDVTKEPPRAHIRITYTGPVYPHWEIIGDYGDADLIDEFARRAYMRLLYIPMKDSQFRRNRERVARDAERERITIEWDLGIPDADS